MINIFKKALFLYLFKSYAINMKTTIAEWNPHIKYCFTSTSVFCFHYITGMTWELSMPRSEKVITVPFSQVLQVEQGRRSFIARLSSQVP